VLILTRRQGQLVRIEPDPRLDPSTPVGELFLDGPIEVLVTHISGSQVRLGILAHPSLVILRNELYDKGGRPDPDVVPNRGKKSK